MRSLLGYRGVVVRSPEGGFWLGYDGIVVRHERAGPSRGARAWDDSGRTFERAVLKTAPAGLLPAGTGP
jgi:hypothetical protein